MEEGDADVGGVVVEEGVEAEAVAEGLCQITHPHNSPLIVSVRTGTKLTIPL